MKFYDISQEVFSSEIYSGDRPPELIAERRMREGDLYNLSSFEMCAHNGTHIDAPFHFFEDGGTVEKIPLENTVGFCYVTKTDGDIDRGKAEEIIRLAMSEGKEFAKRILIKGDGVVSAEGAEAFAEAGILLLGVEGQSVGPYDAPMEVHQILLGKGVALLEGLRLSEVGTGTYFLASQPLSLGGCDGAPCRAVLIKDIDLQREGIIS